MIYGYIRVSTNKQDCENQKLGIETKAKKLGGLLSKVSFGDIIICSELSRLGRKLFMIINILEYCLNRGVKLYTVKDGYELGDNIQSKVLAFAFAISAEIERELISQRTKEALYKRKLSGIRLGRPEGAKNKNYKLDRKKDLVKNMLSKGIPRYKIANKIGVSRATLRRFIGTF